MRELSPLYGRLPREYSVEGLCFAEYTDRFASGCLEDISGSFTTAVVGLFYQLIHEERSKNSIGLREVR